MPRPDRSRTAMTLVALAVPLALLISGCSSGSTTATTTASDAPAASPSVSETNPYGAAPVDPPGPTDTVLSVTGPKGSTDYTLAQLEALGTTTITVAEPFIKAERTFTGVPMAKILDAAGIPATATVETVALNDYRYSTTAGAFTGSDALIATQQDGGPVPYDQGGPIRIVFPDGSELSSVLDAWNWSLASVAVTT